MQKESMEAYRASSPFSSGNAAYLEALYEEYLNSPQTLAPHVRDFFNKLFTTSGDIQKEPSHQKIQQYFQALARKSKTLKAEKPSSLKQSKFCQVNRLVNAYRHFGHYRARTNPLGLVDSESDASKVLMLDYYGLDAEDLKQEFSVDLFGLQQMMPLETAIEKLSDSYCGTLGSEYMHLVSEEERRWIEQRLENQERFWELPPQKKAHLLERLLAAEGLEHYLNAKYPGQVRFSLEGQEALIPLLEEMIQESGVLGVQETVLGMSHRGRLNVLVNILGKSPNDLFHEFEGENNPDVVSGDVKYHQGFSSNLKTLGGPMHLALAFNPSHLEIITPMVAGSVRARAKRLHDTDFSKVMLIALHGDASLSGQGVVMETMNMSQTRGFGIGGTIHVVVNNQVGFTTSKREDLRSTYYCTDVFKGIMAPIFHVNADDPEMVLFVAKLSVEYRMRFKKDVVIDLLGYRRHGHNEADEPLVTQPLLYQKIQKHPSVCALYEKTLGNLGIIAHDTHVEKIIKEIRKALDEGKAIPKNILALKEGEFAAQDLVTAKLEQAIDWLPYFSVDWRQKVNTALALEKIKTLGERLVTLPEGFTLHPMVQKIIENRRLMFEGQKPLDWGCAETLAYAALLNSGYSVRLSGQDSSRSAFFHRHAVLYDQHTDQAYIPLANIAYHQALFSSVDSLLSEEAVLAFEYGYSSADPTSLVIWEAQFGDFANGAQVVIDQFLSSGQQKWGRVCGLVLFLPHGYEGLGPEHSSARLERFLQLCAQQNIQVCIPSSAVQIYHLLCRQMLRRIRFPLIVMTPKSLLRHKAAASDISQFVSGEFKLVIEDRGGLEPADVTKIVVCSGKVYYDLFEARKRKEINNIAILRIEQLYPFPDIEFKEELAKFPNAKTLVWCQEEPKNQGAWYAFQHNLRACMTKGQELLFVGRKASAAPAVGAYSVHLKEQQDLVEAAIQ